MGPTQVFVVPKHRKILHIYKERSPLRCTLGALRLI